MNEYSHKRPKAQTESWADPLTIGNRLRALRENQYPLKSRGEVSQMMQVNKRNLDVWENGECIPTDPNLKILADFYDVSIKSIVEKESDLPEKARPIDWEGVPARLKKIREGKGLSRAELAARAGVAETTTYYIEQRFHSGFHTLQLLADAMEVSLQEIIYEEV